jgi:hypothetical protein
MVLYLYYALVRLYHPEVGYRMHPSWDVVAGYDILRRDS